MEASCSSVLTQDMMIASEANFDTEDEEEDFEAESPAETLSLEERTTSVLNGKKEF